MHYATQYYKLQSSNKIAFITNFFENFFLSLTIVLLLFLDLKQRDSNGRWKSAKEEASESSGRFHNSRHITINQHTIVYEKH